MMMNERKINYEKIEHLKSYLELLLKAQTQGFKFTQEISLAFKQIERELDLDGSSYVLVQNGEVHIKNCTFNPSVNEDQSILVKDGKLSFNGLEVGENVKMDFRGNTILSKAIIINSDNTTNDIETLVEQVLTNGKVNNEILKKLNDMGISVEFSEHGIRWYFK